MSYCSQIPKAKEIDKCFSELRLGNVALSMEDVLVNIQNQVTGLTLVYKVTTDNLGEVTIGNEVEFMEGHTYEAYVTQIGDCTPLDVDSVNGVTFTQVKFDVSDNCYNYDVSPVAEILI